MLRTLLLGLGLFLAIDLSTAWAQSSVGTPSNRVVQKLRSTAVPDGLGVNLHFRGSTEDLDVAKAMGFRVFRTDLLWSVVEQKRGVFDWSKYDLLMDRSRQLGLVPLLILAYSNPLYSLNWKGTDSGRLDWAFEPPVTEEARQAFVTFATAAARRYGGQVIWEVWNEPNLTFGQPPQIAAYLRLAAESCAAMRRAFPDAAIVGPASAGFDWKLLEEFIRSDKDGCFDAVSVHPYRDWDPDTALADWQRLQTTVRRWDPWRRKVAIDSEWGYSVQGGPWTEQRQAAYVLRLYLADLLAGVPLTIVYDLRNDGSDPRDKEQNFGLLDATGRPKPVAGALRGLIDKLDGLSLLGRISTKGRNVTAVAFGAPGKPVSVVAWSPIPQRLTVGPTLCLVVTGSNDQRCDSRDRLPDVEPASFDIGETPTISTLHAR